MAVQNKRLTPPCMLCSKPSIVRKWDAVVELPLEPNLIVALAAEAVGRIFGGRFWTEELMSGPFQRCSNLYSHTECCISICNNDWSTSFHIYQLKHLVFLFRGYAAFLQVIIIGTLFKPVNYTFADCWEFGQKHV